MAEEWKPEYYSQTTLKSFGFTAKMIETMLSEPVLKDNPHYRCAAPMKLWLIAEVDAVMQTDAFKEAVEKRANRRNGAQKAVETKKNKLHEQIQEQINRIAVTVLDMQTLRQQTIADKYEWYAMSWDYYGTISDVANADKATMQRWMVNYVRHNLMEYDDTLYEMSGKVGYRDEYYVYKYAVLDKIADAYPKLKGECHRQKNETENQRKMREAYKKERNIAR